MALNQGRALAFAPVYRQWRESRLGQITDSLEEAVVRDMVAPSGGERVLAVGGGDGKFLAEWAKGAGRPTLLDAGEQMVRAAKARFAGHRSPIDLVVGDAQHLPFADQAFHRVTAVTVLCFVDDAGQSFQEMARVLKPGGRLVIGELGRYSIWAAWRRLRGWLGHPIWRDARFHTARELRNLAAKAGLRVREVRGAIFYPPLGWLAATLAPLDRKLGGCCTFGAAFLALSAEKAEEDAGLSEGREAH